MPFSKAVEVAMSDIDWVGDEDLQEAHRSINIRCDEADAGLVDAHRSINIRCDDVGAGLKVSDAKRLRLRLADELARRGLAHKAPRPEHRKITSEVNYASA